MSESTNLGIEILFVNFPNGAFEISIVSSVESETGLEA